MTALLVFRHAKSDWSADPGGDDADRPLTKRGRKSAAEIGRFMAASSNVPDGAICSPARRAKETLEIAMEAGEWRCPVREEPALYGSVSAIILSEINAESDATDVLLVVGHEPDSSALVSLLIGGGSVRMPTAALARIEFDTRWSTVAPGVGTLSFLVAPRLFVPR